MTVELPAIDTVTHTASRLSSKGHLER